VKKKNHIIFKTFHFDFRINFSLFKNNMKLFIIPTKADKDKLDIKKKKRISRREPDLR